MAGEAERARHTPGPWAVSEAATIDGNFMVVGGSGASFGLLAEVILDEEAEANARLIAAAPELLEALKDVRAWIMDPFTEEDAASETLHPAFRKALKRVSAAIAKAEGQSQ